METEGNEEPFMGRDNNEEDHYKSNYIEWEVREVKVIDPLSSNTDSGWIGKFLNFFGPNKLFKYN